MRIKEELSPCKLCMLCAQPVRWPSWPQQAFVFVRSALRKMEVCPGKAAFPDQFPTSTRHCASWKEGIHESKGDL